MTQHPERDHPLVRRYLAELETLLAGLDPVERAEIVGGVREHLDDLLDGTPRRDEEVQAALAEIGPAAAVADEAYAGRPRVPVGPAERQPVPGTSRVWLPIGVVLLQGLAALLLVLGLGLAVGGATAGGSSTVTTSGPVQVDPRTGDEVESARAVTSTRTTTTDSSFSPGAVVAGTAASFFLALPAWFVLVVLVGVCGLWTGREKAVLMLLTPAAAVVLGGLPLLAGVAVGSGAVPVAALLGLAVALLGGGVVLVVLVRRGLHRIPGHVPAQVATAG